MVEKWSLTREISALSDVRNPTNMAHKGRSKPLLVFSGSSRTFLTSSIASFGFPSSMARRIFMAKTSSLSSIATTLPDTEEKTPHLFLPAYFSANKVLRKLGNGQYVAKNLDKDIEFENYKAMHNAKKERLRKLCGIFHEILDESQMKKPRDDFGFDIDVTFENTVKKEKPVQHAIMVKASESDDDGLVG